MDEQGKAWGYSNSDNSMSEELKRWSVFGLGPLDFFEDCSIPIAQWIKDDKERQQMFMLACYLVFPFVSDDDGGLRHGAYVAYDIGHDESVFIFKVDNNGSTYVVSRNMPKGHLYSEWEKLI